MNKPRLKVSLTGLRSRMNSLAEGRLRNILQRLEKVPPLETVLLRLKPLRWPAYFAGGLLVADLAMMGVGAFLDKGRPPGATRPKIVQDAPYVRNLTAYEPIISRNAFCPGCPVPDMKVRAMERPKDCNKAQPMGSALKLIGTIVLSDPKYSVATVSDNAADSNALLVGDVFKDYGKVLEIRRTRVCFLRDDNSLTFIEMPDEGLRLGQPLPTAFNKTPAEGISRSGDTDFTIKRSFLTAKLNDPNLLYEAQAVPATCQDGSKGFKVMSINPGSVYEALGVQMGDCINLLGNQPMDSIARAQEAYAAIRTTDNISIGIVRNGAPITLNFKVTK